MNRYAEKENYVHRWTVDRRRGHIYKTLLDENADAINDRRVLMLGCNSGSTLRMIDEDYSSTELLGVDINPEAVALAGPKAIQGNILSLTIAGGWDTILALDIVEHIYPEDTPRLVSECARLLSPGGLLLAFSPRTDPIAPSKASQTPAHVQFYRTPDEFTEPWRGAFDVLFCRHETRANPGNPHRHDAWLMLLQKGCA